MKNVPTKTPNIIPQIALVLIVGTLLLLGYLYARGPSTAGSSGYISDIQEYKGVILATHIRRGLLVSPVTGGPSKVFSWAGHGGYFDMVLQASTLVLPVFTDQSQKTTFDVVSVSDPQRPKYRGTVDVDRQIFGDAPKYDFDGRYLFVVGSFDGSVQIIDIDDIANPKKVSELKIDRGNFYTVTVHNDKIYTSFSRIVGAGVGSQERGLQTYDISDTSNPVLLGETLGLFDSLVPYKEFFLSVSGNMLQVLTIEDPNNAHAVTTLRGLPAGSSKVITSGTDALIPFNEQWNLYTTARKSSGVLRINISNPTYPKAIKTYQTRGFAQSAIEYNGRIYIADYFNVTNRRLSCIQIFKSFCI